MSAQEDTEDDMSDVSMSAETDESDSESDDAQNSDVVTASDQLSHEIEATTDAYNQREAQSQGAATTASGGPPSKRQHSGNSEMKLELLPDDVLNNIRTKDGRLPKDRSLLPPEVWQHIFTFTPPISLGRLLSVNKRFSAYLDPSLPSISSSVTPLSHTVVSLRSPESIWQASRQHYHPWLPSPMQGYSELDMWRLALGSQCQFCGKIQKSSNPNTDTWHRGPGESGVRGVWAFGMRACGTCLRERTVKV
jgi:hypothetical protein